MTDPPKLIHVRVTEVFKQSGHVTASTGTRAGDPKIILDPPASPPLLTMDAEEFEECASASMGLTLATSTARSVIDRLVAEASAQIAQRQEGRELVTAVRRRVLALEPKGSSDWKDGYMRLQTIVAAELDSLLAAERRAERRATADRLLNDRSR